MLLLFSCNKSDVNSCSREIRAIKDVLNNKWANKNVHSQKDMSFFDKIFTSAEQACGKEKDKYAEHLDKAIRGLHDGHLRFTPSSDIKQIKRYSGMVIEAVKEGYALIKCEYNENCKGLTLPMLLVSIDSVRKQHRLEV